MKLVLTLAAALTTALPAAWLDADATFLSDGAAVAGRIVDVRASGNAIVVTVAERLQIRARLPAAARSSDPLASALHCRAAGPRAQRPQRQRASSV
jgi:hypothetical protein